MKFLKSAIFVLILTSCTGRVGRLDVDAAAVCDTLEYATGFQIERHDGYTAVKLRDPWDTLRQRQCYLLVDREKPVSENLPSGTVIKVPVKNVVVYTSVHAALLKQIGCLDRICGICEPQYLTDGEIRALVENGEIQDLGQSTSPNVEKIMDSRTELIIATPFENSSYGAAEKLGIPIIEASDYMENHPLGRTEWVRFFSLLFDREAAGDSIFLATVNNYMRLKALAASASERPTVLLERKYGSTWFVPSGKSYIGTLHKDAGARYLFADRQDAGNAPLSFETVFDTAVNADFWLFKYDAKHRFTYKELKEEYPPYAEFDAFKKKMIFACNTVSTSYYDDITLHPDLILEDLVAVYHPELLPEHIFRYYHPLLLNE